MKFRLTLVASLILQIVFSQSTSSITNVINNEPHYSFSKVKIARKNREGLKQDSLHKENFSNLDFEAKKIKEDYTIVFYMVVNDKGEISFLKFDANKSNFYDDKIIKQFEKIIRSLRFEQTIYKKTIDCITIDAKKSIDNLFYRN